MNFRVKPVLSLLIILGICGALGWGVFQKLESHQKEKEQKPDKLPAPVEVVEIELGTIEQIRSFTGTLEARSEFVVAPKISGRIEQLKVGLADQVKRGQVVAVMDDDERVQEVARAEAELAVEMALYLESESLLKISERELERLVRLQARGDVAEAQLDITRSELVAKQALTEVAKARITRAEAELESSRIRLNYTQVKADWKGGSKSRVVAERFVNTGETVAANAALLRIVELNPITAVFYITERDYAQVKQNQAASLSTEAFPGEQFEGKVKRISPVFDSATRQARIELLVNNPELRLKPGMFVRALLTLQAVKDATIVPEQALIRRDDLTGVFLVDEDRKTARWKSVEVGIRQSNKVQIVDPPMSGRIVILGQQLLEDGSDLRVMAK
ncbi:MAG: RND family efflux transporter MFP subunit [Gammaproteobacteria bacterium]